MALEESYLMTNTIFYTFSTIAQTLAGAIALLGAFALYRLQSLRSEIEKDSSEIVEIYSLGVGGAESVKIFDWHNERKYQLIAGLPAGYDQGNIELAPSTKYSVTTMQSRLRRNLDQKDSFLQQFKISLWFTAIIIVFSVLALVGAERIARSNTYCWVFLSLGLLWFAGCLYSYILLILKGIE